MSKQSLAQTQALVAVIPGAVALPDTGTHCNRMEIRSESSNNIYVVSQAKATGEVQCSCPGWIFKRPGRERSCKHVKAIAPLLQLASSQAPVRKLR